MARIYIPVEVYVYSTSFSYRIVELKNIVAGEQAKLNKSAILRKAIEYIKYLSVSIKLSSFWKCNFSLKYEV